MPMLRTGLLTEYLRVNSIITNTTLGSKITWNNHTGRINLNSRPYIFCATLGMIFGLSVGWHSVSLVIAKSTMYTTISIIIACDVVVCYFMTWNQLQICSLLELFMNNFLMLEFRVWNNCEGILVTSQSM